MSLLSRIPSHHDSPSTAVDRQRARHWLAVAIGSLLLAGVFALLLVIGRMPPLSLLLTDPGFFRRALVVHVDLALIVWFYAFVAALFSLVPSRIGAHTAARHAPYIAGLGLVLLMAAAGIPSAEPILANYLPVLDHPLYLVGLVLVGIALFFTVLEPRLLPRAEADGPGALLPPAALPLVRASALAILLALFTFAAAIATTGRGGAPALGYFEAVMWGGGHVLQFASVAAMLATWVALLATLTGRAPLSRAQSFGIAAWLMTPLLAAPLLVLAGTASLTYRVGFTRYMQFGIAPPVVVAMVLTFRAWRRDRPARPLTLAEIGIARGLGASGVLTLLGFFLGATISGSNTVVPAHYHASIGGVTVAFMAFAYPLLERLGLRALDGRWARLSAWQPALLGIGQAIFAAGFAMAGAHGMQRKSYANEQQIRSTAEWIGLGVMGTGGLIAIAGGLLFLFLVGVMWRRSLVAESALRGRAASEVIHVGR